MYAGLYIVYIGAVIAKSFLVNFKNLKEELKNIWR